MFHATNQPGTCLWCGHKLRKEVRSESTGYRGNGFFCTAGCGYLFAVAAARNGYRFEPKSEPPPVRKRPPPVKTPKCPACGTRTKIHDGVQDECYLFCNNPDCERSHEWFLAKWQDDRLVFADGE